MTEVLCGPLLGISPRVGWWVCLLLHSFDGKRQARGCEVLATFGDLDSPDQACFPSFSSGVDHSVGLTFLLLLIKPPAFLPRLLVPIS